MKLRLVYDVRWHPKYYILCITLDLTAPRIGTLREVGNGDYRLSKGPVISIVEDDAAVRAATENLVKSLPEPELDRMFDFGCADANVERDRVADSLG